MALSPEQSEELAMLKARFETEWGAFRRYIALNPLSGFWLGVALGGAVVFGAALVL